MSDSDFTLTADVLRQHLSYDPLTGEFMWLIRARGKQMAKPAGFCKDKRTGYRAIQFNTVTYYAHHLAWLHVHGVWPSHEIDHKDGVPSNNRISNLRDVTHTVNGENRRRPHSNNQLGILGVSMSRGRYKAQIGIQGKIKNLGRFATLEEASAAYLKAKRQLHEGCTI